MNGREYVTYLAENGFEIPLSDEQIKNVDEETIEDILNTLQRGGKINSSQHPLWALLDCIIKEMDVSKKDKLLLRETLRNPYPDEIISSLVSFQRLVNILPQYGQNNKIAQEFIRCKTLLDKRAANRKYPAVVERIKVLPTPSWLAPGRRTFDISQEKIITKDACFGVDFSLCAEYLKAQGLVPVCDSSVESIILRGIYPCSHPEYLEIFEHVVFTGMQTLNRLIKDYDNVVWISCGTQFGLPLRYPECEMDESYKVGRLYGVVGASALNGGYGALTLYQRDDKTCGRGKLGNSHIEFRRGVYKDFSASNCQNHSV